MNINILVFIRLSNNYCGLIKFKINFYAVNEIKYIILINFYLHMNIY